MSIGTVLFVDDEANILMALERLFIDDDDVTVVTATSVEAGLKILANQEVELVVSDRVMPGTDGVEFLGRVRKLYPDIPLMMLSGYGDDIGPEVFDKLGKLPIIDKPWDSDHLRDIVLTHLSPLLEDGTIEDVLFEEFVIQ